MERTAPAADPTTAHSVMTAPRLWGMTWTFRFLAATLLCSVCTSATLGETEELNRFRPAVFFELKTALAIAPDGSWGVATEIETNRAIAVAIANCKKMYRKDIGCGSQFTLISAGWSLAIRCGNENIIVAEKTLDDAVEAAVKRETVLRLVYAREMPACMRVLTVNPHGVIIRHDLEASPMPVTECPVLGARCANLVAPTR